MIQCSIIPKLRFTIMFRIINLCGFPPLRKSPKQCFSLTNTSTLYKIKSLLISSEKKKKLMAETTNYLPRALC